MSIGFAGDPSFTPPERAAIEQAMADWHDLSGGLVTFSVEWTDLPVFGTKIIRSEVKDPWVQDLVQRRHTKIAGVEEATPSGIVIHIVPEEVRNGLWEVAAHELGHAAGLRMPHCDSKIQDCEHLPEGKTVMAPTLNGSTRFTVYDYWLCQESCLCR